MRLHDPQDVHRQEIEMALARRDSASFRCWWMAPRRRAPKTCPGRCAARRSAGAPLADSDAHRRVDLDLIVADIERAGVVPLPCRSAARCACSSGSAAWRDGSSSRSRPASYCWCLPRWRSAGSLPARRGCSPSFSCSWPRWPCPPCAVGGGEIAVRRFDLGGGPRLPAACSPAPCWPAPYSSAPCSRPPRSRRARPGRSSAPRGCA